jgi:hypothetical protein
MLEMANHPIVTAVDDSSSFGASGGDHLGASSGTSKASTSTDSANGKSQDSQKQFEQLSGQIPDIALTTTEQFRLAEEIMDLDLGDGGGNPGGNSRRGIRSELVQGISHASASSTQSRLNPSAYHRQMSYPRNE